MKLIPYHQDDKDGSREYRSPDGTWRVVRTPATTAAGTTGRAGRFTIATRTVSAAGTTTPPSSAGGTRWSSWTPRLRRRGARTSRQCPPSGPRPPNSRRNHPSPARAGRRRGRSRTTSTKPAPRTSRGRLCGVLLYDSRQIAPVYQPNVARPRTPLLAAPCSGLSRRCASMPSSRLRLPRFSSPRP